MENRPRGGLVLYAPSCTVYNAQYWTFFSHEDHKAACSRGVTFTFAFVFSGLDPPARAGYRISLPYQALVSSIFFRFRDVHPPGRNCCFCYAALANKSNLSKVRFAGVFAENLIGSGFL